MSRSSSAQSQRGMTLIETMVGLAILALAAAALISTYELMNRSRRSLNEDDALGNLSSGIQKILTTQSACDLNLSTLPAIPPFPANAAIPSFGFPSRDTLVPANNFVSASPPVRFMGLLEVQSLKLSSLGSISTVAPYKEAFRLTLTVRRPDMRMSLGTPLRTKTFDFIAETSQPLTSSRTISKCVLPPPPTSGSTDIAAICTQMGGTFTNPYCDMAPATCKTLGVGVDSWVGTTPPRCNPGQLRQKLLFTMFSGKGCPPGQFVKAFNADGTPLCAGVMATPSPPISAPDKSCSACYLDSSIPCATATVSPQPTPSPTESYWPQFRLFQNGLMSGTLCAPKPNDTLKRCGSESRPCGP